MAFYLSAIVHIVFLSGTFDHQVPSPLIQFILGMLFLKYKSEKALKPSYKEFEAMYGCERQGAFRVGPITWLQLDFLRLVIMTFQQMGLFNPRFFSKWASQPMTLLQMGFFDPYFSQQKNGAFGYANSQTRNIYKAMQNINYSPHAASAMCARGVNVDTHSSDTFCTSPIQTSPTFM